VSLTAKANSGQSFVSWGGACAGFFNVCTVNMLAESTVTAQFTSVAGGGGGGGGGGGAGGSQFTLSVGRTNVGTVVATPSGVDRALNCGSACSAKFNAGTAVTLTATPPAGLQFLNWAGACSGVSASCTVTMNADTSVQAVFSK
jgi:hypothetical protein